MVSFRGQKKLGPRPDRSLLGVWAPGLIQNFRRASVPPSYADSSPPPQGSSSGASFFAHRRERNASDTRGTGVQVQGTMGRRQGADTKREGEREIRAPLALLGAQIPPSPFNACHEG